MKQVRQQDDSEIVTAYTAGADAAPPAYPGQPRNVRADLLPAYVPPRISGVAKLAVVFAGLGLLVPLMSILAIVCGTIALGMKEKLPRGRTMAIAAIAMGAFEVVLFALIAGVFEH